MPFIVPETVYDCVLFKGSYGTLKLSDEHLSFHTPEKVSIVPWRKVAKRQVASASSKTTKPMFKLILKSGTEAVFQMEDRVSLEVLRDDLGDRLKTWRRLNPEKPEEQEENVAVNKTNFTGRRQSTPYRMVNTNAEARQQQQQQQPHQPRRSSYSTKPSTPEKTHRESRRASYMGPSVEKPQRKSSEQLRSSYYRMGSTPSTPEKVHHHHSEPRRSSYMGHSSSTTEKPHHHHRQPRRSSYSNMGTPSSDKTYRESPQSHRHRRSSYHNSPQKGTPERRRRSTNTSSPPPFCRTLSAETIKKTNNRRSARYHQ